jgi:hypothetical protein
MPRKLIFIALLSGSAPAYAQQASNNAVTQSEDAFGRAVGNERIGIYSNEEVRGFNPLEAGNNRLEGLYIDQGQITSRPVCLMVHRFVSVMRRAARLFPHPPELSISGWKNLPVKQNSTLRWNGKTIAISAARWRQNFPCRATSSGCPLGPVFAKSIKSMDAMAVFGMPPPA